MKKRTLIFISISLALAMIGCSATVSTDGSNININMDESSRIKAVELPTYELPDDEFARAMDPQLNYLILVNKDHPYEFGGAYDQQLQKDLACIADCYVGEATPIEKGTLYAFTQLQYALEQKGMKVGLFNAYRTYDDQVETNHLYPETMPPGLSEHHTGLVLDIMIWWTDKDGNGEWYTETAERQAEIPEFKIVHETLADYGFIDRYPAGKEDITGVPCEPFEIRFVGSSKIAHEIMDNGLCLEEYLENR